MVAVQERTEQAAVVARAVAAEVQQQEQMRRVMVEMGEMGLNGTQRMVPVVVAAAEVRGTQEYLLGMKQG